MKAKELRTTLAKIEQGELYDIFNLLPEVAGGADWLAEIKDTAWKVAEYIYDEEDEVDLDTFRDYGHEFANSECEDYYNNINARVQTLSLWASNDIDAEVSELNQGRDYPSLTELNSQYLFTAMRMLWDAVVDQAFQNTEETEEEQE